LSQNYESVRMARNQISFFAAKDDLSSLLRAVESERRLQFVVGGMFDEMPDVEAQDLLLGSLELEGATSTINSVAYLLFGGLEPPSKSDLLSNVAVV
jgi:hypothetical protein